MLHPQVVVSRTIRTTSPESRRFHAAGLAALLVTLAIVGAPTIATSQTNQQTVCETYVPPEEGDKADLIAIRGVNCFEAGRFDVALQHYRHAMSVSKSPLLLAAIGRSLHELGLYSLARTYYTSYMQQSKDGDEGREKIQERLDALAKQVSSESGTLELNVLPANAEVQLQLPSGHTEPLGTGRHRLSLAPGNYRVFVNHDGYYSYDNTVTVSVGETTEVDSFLVSQDAVFNNTPQEWKRAGVYTMIASAPVIAASVTFWLMSLNYQRDADSPNPTDEGAAEDALLFRQLGTITAVVGVGVLASGITLYAIGLGEEDDLREAPISPVEDDKASASLSGPRLELGVGSLRLWF